MARAKGATAAKPKSPKAKKSPAKKGRVGKSLTYLHLIHGFSAKKGGKKGAKKGAKKAASPKK
jgi:hypothetical protein